jgi:tetratricopeptide (TPR) repeat protein
MQSYEKAGNYKAVENYLTQFLLRRPHELEVWLRLGVLMLLPANRDFQKSMYCFKRVLSVEPKHMEATLLLACAMKMAGKPLDEEIINRLFVIHSNQPEEKAMICFVRSWVFEQQQDWLKFEEWLVESIQAYPYHVFNYIALSTHYLSLSRVKEAFDLRRRALANIQGIYPAKGQQPIKGYPLIYKYDSTDYQEFFNGHIKGIHCTPKAFRQLVKELHEIRERMTKK